MGRIHRLFRAAAFSLLFASLKLASPACALALDPSLDISQYAHTSWKVRDGFVPGEILAIAQTPDGYLWLGTESGLFRFDGVRAAPWHPPGGEQLPSSNVRNLLVTRDGTLWIATLKGLASWRDGKLTEYPEAAGQLLGVLLQDREGRVWFTSALPGRLCAIQGGKVQCYGSESFGRSVVALYQDHNDDLWVSATTGLWRWKPGPPKRYPFPHDVVEANSLTESDSGTLLLATNGGLKQLVGGKIQTDALPGLAGQFRPSSFLRGSDGSLWIGSHQGLGRIRQGRVDTFWVADGLSGEQVYRIFEDREGNVWVVTAGGLDRFREYAVPRMSRNQDLSASYAFSVQATADGAIWIGTTNGLNRWQDGHLTVYGKQSGRGDGRELRNRATVTEIAHSGLASTPQSLGLDDQGRLWVSSGDGVFYLQSGRFTRVLGVPGGNIFGIAEDDQGKVWISNSALGLSYVTMRGEPAQAIPWSRLRREGSAARALLADRSQGGVWLGFYEGGVVYFREGQVRASYTAADGLGSGRVNQLRFGSLGGMWAATEGGLSRIKDGHIATLTSKNGLPCDEVHWSVEDDDHFVWAFMPCGLARIAPSEWHAWVNDPRRSVQTTIYDSSDGVPSVGIYGGYGPRVTKARDGKIWFTHSDGVSVIDPRHLPLNKLPPPVHVDQITADGKSYEAASFETGGLRLPPRVRDLAIDYTALSFVAPEKVRFRYKLEGRDRDWQNAGNRRQAYYTDLPPGNYRFRVTASNNSGVWNESGAFLDFSVTPAYYQAAWFRILCVVAFGGLLWALYQYRLQQLRQQFNLGLEERVGERTRIARELHDTLLQSFHGLMFQFQAARNMLPGRTDEAIKTLDVAIRATEQAIEDSRDAIQDLRPQSASKGDLAQLLRTAGEELVALQDGNHGSAAFRVIVEGEPQELSPTLQDEAYRIGREIIRNALRHADARRIEVEIRYDQRMLRLRIRDDGKGIDPKVLKDSGRAGHWGLPGVRERAQRIGARLDFWSEAGAGTEVELIVPAGIAYQGHRDRPRFALFGKVGSQ